MNGQWQNEIKTANFREVIFGKVLNNIIVLKYVFMTPKVK
jgi:hypothetical protein